MDFSPLSGDSPLGDDCGALRLGDVRVKWESQARKGGGELGEARLREVLTGWRLFVMGVEVASAAGSVQRRSRLKGVCLAVLSGVSSIRRPVLGISKWRVVHLLLRLVQ